MPVFRPQTLSRRRRSKGLGGILLSVGRSAQLLATDPILLPMGASWRFRLNRPDDTTLSPHWVEPDFHDSH